MKLAPDDLPTGWQLSTIEQLAEPGGIGYGVLKPGEYVSNGTPMLRVSDVKASRVDTSSIYRINEELDHEFRRTKLQGGELLVSIQGSVGRVAIVPSELAGANISRTLAMIRLRNIELAPWLQRMLESPQVQQTMREVIGGTTRDSLNLRDLRRIEVPIPPEPQRLALVDLLERSFRLKASSLGHLSRVRGATERFRHAVLAAGCSGRLTADWREGHSQEQLPNTEHPRERPGRFKALTREGLPEIPESWAWVQVDDLLPPGGIFDGPFGSNLKSSDYTSNGPRVLRLENIGHLQFIGSKKVYVSDQKFEQLKRHAVFPGDILFSSFVAEAIRVCTLPEGLDSRTLAKADCFTLRPGSAVVRPYLVLQLACPRTFKFLAADVHGATRPRINTTQLRSLAVPICSLAEQSEIVRRVDQLMRLAESLETRIDTAAHRLKRNSGAVLGKAYRGELLNGEWATTAQ